MKTNEQLHDEIFCLNYELRTLATIITHNKLERWLPGFTDPITDYDHQKRYDWACGFVKDKKVLDIACGSGKGSYTLVTAGQAKQVTGCDIEEDAVKYSSIKYKHAGLSYEVQDATAINKQELFDVIISFETVEHIEKTDLYLASMHKHLKDDGLFIVSTPISKKAEDLSPKNPFHVKEWGFKKFQEVVASQFTLHKIYLQLHQPKPYGRLETRYNSIFPKKAGKGLPEIEEYQNNVDIAKLGKQILGYQILVCKK